MTTVPTAVLPERSPTSTESAQAQTPDFLAAVHAFCHLLYQTKTLDEAKVATYLFEHTICFQEFGRLKRITLDEFAHGRKRRDRTRMDSGCGVGQRSHVSEALARLQGRQQVIALTDEQDRARRKKSYALNINCSRKRNTHDGDPVPIIDLPVQPVPESGTLSPEAADQQGQTVPESGTQSSRKRNTEFPKAERDQSKYSGKYLEEIPSSTQAPFPHEGNAPAVRTSQDDVQGRDAQEFTDKRRTLHEIERKIRQMQKSHLIGAYLRSLIQQADTLRQELAETPPVALSDSQSSRATPFEPADPLPSSDLSLEAGEALAPAPEAVEQAEDLAEAEEEEPAATLFPEALPPARVDWVQTVGGWFYDLEHIDARDMGKIKLALGKLRARGYTDIYDVESRFYRWHKRYAELKRKTIIHFADHLQEV